MREDEEGGNQDEDNGDNHPGGALDSDDDTHAEEEDEPEEINRMARANGNKQGYGMDRLSADFGGINLADDVPIHRAAGERQQEERQAKNTREATKALRDRLKDESKKFDGSDIFGMVLFIVVSEEILETYNIADTCTADMQNPDAVTVMFNNLQGPARDWIRTQKEVAPSVLRSQRIFKDVLIAKYFGGDTPFEGYAPLYQVKQREGQSVRDFGVTLTMLGIYLGRRQASVIPKKKEYLTKRKFGQHDGILDRAGREDTQKFRFFDFYDFVSSHYFEATNKYFSGAAEHAPWFALATARVASEGQVSDMCERGKHQFIHSPYNDGTVDHPRWVMNGMPHSSVWPTIELRTVVRAVGQGGKLAFYQDKNTRANKKYKSEPSATPANKHELTPAEWPIIENGMTLGDAPHPIEGPEEISNKSKDDVYEEYIYRIARTRSTTEPTKATFDEETMRSPLKDKNGRSFYLDRLANEHFWTSTPDGIRPDGSADSRKKPKGFENTHVIKPDATNSPKTHNVSQGLLRVVQRAMAAGVMIELYRQMQEVSLFCFVNNALPRIKAHLYENMDRFHSVEEAMALAERFEMGRSGGVISKFNISAFQEHMGYTTNDYNSNNNNNTDISSHLADQTQEELDHQYGDQSYDGQINAIGRSFRRGGRRNTGSWSRGRGFGGSSGGFRPFVGNIERGKGLGNYHNANEAAATKKQLLCYRCGSSNHIVKDCQYAPVSTDGPKDFTRNRRGRFKTFQRRERFNAMGGFMGTEDVPVYYDSETIAIRQ